jgi:Flp pilus assembly protein TadD
VPLAFGGYVAFLVHAAADWDWELPAVTLVGVLCASAILAAARTTARTPPFHIGQTSRWAMAGASVLVAGLATIGLLGNTALSRSRTALVRGDVSTALTDARRARALMPWSPQPWEALGNADLEQGLLPQARRSFRKAVAIDPGDWGLWSQLAAVTRGSERTAALRRVKILYPQAEIASAQR